LYLYSLKISGGFELRLIIGGSAVNIFSPNQGELGAMV